VLIEGEKTGRIIGAAIEVHRNLGPGLLESTYEECLLYELNELGFSTQRQVELPIIYKGEELESKYRLDVLVDNQIIIELKACKKLEPIHEAQILTYLKMANLRYGLLINFNVPVLKQGLKRILNS
jgi:GxxExxY protein